MAATRGTTGGFRTFFAFQTFLSCLRHCLARIKFANQLNLHFICIHMRKYCSLINVRTYLIQKSYLCSENTGPINKTRESARSKSSARGRFTFEQNKSEQGRNKMPYCSSIISVPIKCSGGLLFLRGCGFRLKDSSSLKRPSMFHDLISDRGDKEMWRRSWLRQVSLHCTVLSVWQLTCRYKK